MTLLGAALEGWHQILIQSELELLHFFSSAARAGRGVGTRVTAVRHTGVFQHVGTDVPARTPVDVLHD